MGLGNLNCLNLRVFLSVYSRNSKFAPSMIVNTLILKIYGQGVIRKLISHQSSFLAVFFSILQHLPRKYTHFDSFDNAMRSHIKGNVTVCARRRKNGVINQLFFSVFYHSTNSGKKLRRITSHHYFNVKFAEL